MPISLSGSLLLTGSLTTSGTLTAQTLVVQTVTSSVVYSSGSNIFGNQLTNVQQMTGSLRVTGSLSLNNVAIPTSASLASTYLPLTGGTLTGALSGTSATFSTDLVVNGWLRPNSIYAFTADAGTTYIQQPSGGNIVLRKSDSTAFLTIANTGAATFSSSVTLSSLVATPSYGSDSVGINLGYTNIQNVVGQQACYANNIFYDGSNWKGISSTIAYAQAVRLQNGNIDFHNASVTTSNQTMSNWDTTDLKMRITSGGLVGIGRTPTTNILEINGDASKTSAGSWLANSDINIKTDINTIQGALERINKVRLVSFKYKDEYKEVYTSIKDKYYQNVIAQEYQEIYPDYVYDSGEIFEEHNILQVDTNPMFVDSVSAIQELSKIVQEQQIQIEELKALIAAK